MSERDDDALTERLKRAAAAYEAMSPLDRALHHAAQRRSFVRGQSGRDPGPDVLAEEVRSLRARLSSAEAERDRLREGLELFVRHGRAMGVFGGDNGPYRYYTGSGYREVPVEDFRRARALLTPQADGTETR